MDPDERAELVRRLFALITSKFEDGAGRAVDGQSAQTDTAAKFELAEQLHSLAEELLVLAEAAGAMCRE